MKARISTLLVVVVAALSIAAGASAAPHQTTVKGSDYASIAPKPCASRCAAGSSWSGFRPWATAGWTRAQV